MFRIDTHDEAEAIVLVVTGEVDIVTVDEFCERGLEAIAQADGRSVAIDVAAVTFIDSSGLGALVTLNNAATTGGTLLTLRAVPPRMASMLKITALDTVIALSDRPEPDL